MLKWICKKYDWDNEATPPNLEDSHYLECSNCGHLHPIYKYNVWTNTLSLCTAFGDKVKIPNYCSNCGKEMYKKRGD